MIKKTVRHAANIIKKTIRHAANAAGIDIPKYPGTEWRWSYNVDDYYPVDPIPRWGHGKPPHPQISEILHQQRSDFSALLHRFSRCSGVLASVPLEGDPDSKIPFWRNGGFENLDAVALVGMLVSGTPTRYMEIGSGNSTKFARHAIQHARLPTSIVSLDPNPRGVGALCDKIVHTRLEDCDLSLFDQLEAGDILFLDGSHRVFTNSDVTVFFLELMPRLTPGVIIHVHDILLPWDYLPEWNKRMYSEQYILAAMMLCPRPLFKVLLPNWFVCDDPELGVQVKSLLEPFGCIAKGGSFWMEKV